MVGNGLEDELGSCRLWESMPAEEVYGRTVVTTMKPLIFGCSHAGKLGRVSISFVTGFEATPRMLAERLI